MISFREFIEDIDNLQKVDEATLDGMFTKHSDAGYVIISAFRHENDRKTNEVLNRKMKEDLKANKFSYFPAWGGFIEKDKDDKDHEVKEKCFVITNFAKGTQGAYDNDKDLKSFGMELCKKYKQQSFLFKPMGDSKQSYYIDERGKVEQKFNTVSPTKMIDVYFTTLHKKESKDRSSKSFTFSESIDLYLKSSPKSLAEAKIRYGELFFNLSR